MKFYRAELLHSMISKKILCYLIIKKQKFNVYVFNNLNFGQICSFCSKPKYENWPRPTKFCIAGTYCNPPYQTSIVKIRLFLIRSQSLRLVCLTFLSPKTNSPTFSLFQSFTSTSSFIFWNIISSFSLYSR